MAKTVNLLPVEYAPSGSAAKLAGTLNNIVFLGLTVFILVLVGAVSFFLINYFSIQDSQRRQEVLKTSIKSLETTETRMVLVQDRLKIAQKIMAKDSVLPDISALDSLLPNITGTLAISEADVSPNKTQFSVLSGSSLELAKFMAALTSGNLYKKVDLVAFSFSPQGGYLSTFETQTK